MNNEIFRYSKGLEVAAAASIRNNQVNPNLIASLFRAAKSDPDHGSSAAKQLVDLERIPSVSVAQISPDDTTTANRCANIYTEITSQNPRPDFAEATRRLIEAAFNG